MPEEKSFTKSGSGVGSMVYDNLSSTGEISDTIHLFADNTAALNKNQYLFSLPAAIVCKNEFGSKQTRLSFMSVGQTQFAPVSWLGLLKLVYRESMLIVYLI